LALRAAGRLAFLEARGHPLDDAGRLLRLGLRLALRGHLAGVQALEDVAPAARGGHAGEVARQGVDAELALLLLVAVAADAMGVEEGADGLVEVLAVAGGRRPRLEGGSRQEQGQGQQPDAHQGSLEGFPRGEARPPLPRFQNITVYRSSLWQIRRNSVSHSRRPTGSLRSFFGAFDILPRRAGPRPLQSPRLESPEDGHEQDPSVVADRRTRRNRLLGRSRH